MTAPDVLVLRDDERAARRVGRVIAGSGADYLVMIEAGERTHAVSAGDHLVFGASEARSVAAVTATSVPAPAGDDDLDEIWIAEVTLIGTLAPGGFERGVLHPPSLGDAAQRAEPADLAAIYGAGEGRVSIGTLARATDIEVSVRMDALAAGFGVFGTSDSGKSCTVATLVRGLLRRRAPVRPILLDAHDEYARSFGRAATLIRPGAGFVPHWLLTFEELCWALSLDGGPLGAEEVALLAEAVPAARRRMLQRQGEDTAMPVTLDAPAPWRLTDAVSWLDKNTHTDRDRAPGSYKRLRARLVGAPTDARLRAVFGAVAATDTLPGLLRDVFGLGAAEDAPPMTIVQLGRLELGLDRLVAAVLCRLALAVGEGTGGRVPTLLLAEDAERYAPRDEANRIAELSRQAMEGLARRGARVGAGLAVTSARPGLVSSRLMAELPTAFVHRLPSGEAQRDLTDHLPEGGAATIAGANTLGQRDCIALGRAVAAPGLLRIAALPDAALPRSARGGPIDANAHGADLVARLLSRWRFGAEGEGPSGSVAAAPEPRTAHAPPRVVPAA